MLAEYKIGINLKHNNIAEYKYFMQIFDPISMSHQLHLVLELVKGQNLRAYAQG